MEYYHIAILFGIMFFAGLFGGVINYLLELRDNPKKASLLRSMVAGTGASFLVPLFLNMISSDLISKSVQEPQKYLIFLGFCLIASISSSAFIRTLSDKILKEAKEAKEIANEVKEELQPVINKQTEIDLEDNQNILLDDSEKLSELKERVLGAFIGSNFTWRSTTGIAKELNLQKSIVEQELFELCELGYLNYKESVKGGKRWSISFRGRIHYMQS